jgi:hypothetical protein
MGRGDAIRERVTNPHILVRSRRRDPTYRIEAPRLYRFGSAC